MAKQCPITREQFEEHAKPLQLQLDGKTYEAEPRTFSSDSLGWNWNFKTYVEIDGVRVQVQVGCNVTVVGSKELP